MDAHAPRTIHSTAHDRSKESELIRFVAVRRQTLANYSCHESFRRVSRERYHELVVSALDTLCDSLESVHGQHHEISLSPQIHRCSLSRDPNIVLFEHPSPIYQAMNICEWLRRLPNFSNQLLGVGGAFGLIYTMDHIRWLELHCAEIIRLISDEMKGSSRYTANVRDHLFVAMDELHRTGADPSIVGEEFAAIALYTLELPLDSSVIRSSSIHGSNPSLYSVMNFASRLFRNPSTTLGTEELNALHATLELFLPLLARLDVVLSRLPAQRTTMYRGIRAEVSSSMYKTGSLLPWTALSSTTADFRAAHEFGYTMFVVHVHNAPVIDFATAFPAEAEHLLPSYTWVKAIQVMSPTLLRILVSTCYYVTVQTVGDEPTIEETIERLVSNGSHQRLIFEKFLSRYVESAVHPNPPPLPPSTNCPSLFSAVDSWLEQSSPRHVLLLGSGGIGKSSASLALYCKLSQRQTAFSDTSQRNPLIVAFISLPSTELGKQGPSSLDTVVIDLLGVRRDQMQELLKRCEIILLFDSLDECGTNASKWFPLIDQTIYCRQARVVVSCRTEYLSSLALPEMCMSSDCKVLHIQPFSDSRVHEFLSKNLSNSTGTLDELTLVGVSKELQSSPVALRMGVELIHWHRTNGFQTCPRPFQSPLICAPQSRIALYQSYLALCRSRWTRQLVQGRMQEQPVALSDNDASRVNMALQDVAITMLAKGTWKLPLVQVFGIFQEYLGGSSLSVKDALSHVPMRLESLEDLEAEFSFWHKSIGEFLCAVAFFSAECSRYLRLASTASQSSFSLGELGVLSWFNELAVNDFARREWVCGQILMNALASSQRSSGEASTLTASNALALLVISQYPLGGKDLSHLQIRKSLLFEGCFRSALLDGTRFEDCDLNRTSFEGASIHGTEFVRCSFGSLVCAPIFGHTGNINSVSWSPDGRLIASASADKTIRIAEAENGIEIKAMVGHSDAVSTICWSPNQQLLASGSKDKTVRIWDVTSGQELTKSQLGKRFQISSVCWASNGRFILCGSIDGMACVLDASTLDIVQSFQGFDAGVDAICWGPDDKVAAVASRDQVIRLHDVTSGGVIRELRGHTSKITDLCWNSKSRLLASGSRDCTLRLWHPMEEEEIRTLRFNKMVTSLGWDSSGKLVAVGSQDGCLYLVDAAGGSVVKTLHASQVWVNSISWKPHGNRIVSGSGNAIRIWNVAVGREVHKVDGHRDSVESVCWSRDGKYIASASADRTIRIWDSLVGCPLNTLVGHESAVNSVDWKDCVATASDDNTVRVWDPVTGSEINRLRGHHNGRVTSVHWSPNNGLIASGSDDMTVIVWDAVDGGRLRTLVGHDGFKTFVAWSSDGHWLACASDLVIQLWDVTREYEMKLLEGHLSRVTCLSFWGVNLQLLASGSWDTSVRIWDLANGAEQSVVYFEKSVTACSWNPRNKLIAVGLDNGSVHIIDAITEQPVHVFRDHQKGIRCLNWSSDGARLASASQDGTVRIWPIGGQAEPQFSLVFGRERGGTAPFGASGALGQESRNDAFLNSYVFSGAR